jgi:NTP pyrophosphatase (non-canonical NTP hydrolase)
MKLVDYQQLAKTTAIYPKKYRVIYPALGLAGEAGEVAGKVKKLLRGDRRRTPQAIACIGEELGDVLWYLAATASDLGLDLNRIALQNLKKLHDRKQRGVLKGSGDRR